jgi:hypothetical protein
MAANATQSNVELINALMGIPSKLFGSTQTQTTSGGSTTQQTNISQAGVDALLKSMMEGTTGRPGLAAVAQGQRGAGLYNTNVRSMLVNDLVARSAAEVEKLRSPTTTTREPTTVKTKTPGAVEGMSPLGLLLGAGALAAGTKKGRDLIGGLFGSGLEDATIGADVAQAGMGFGAAADWGSNMDILGTSLADSSFIDTLGGWGEGGIAALADPGFVDVLGGFGDFAGSFADPGFVDVLGGAGDFAGVAGDAAGGIPYLGAALNVAEGDYSGALLSGVGYAVGGPIGGVVGGLVDSIFGGDDGGCFITTAVCKVYGKPDDCDELTTLRKYRDSYLKDKHPEDIQTYYDIAPTIVLRVNEREDADVIWVGLYKNYIVPAIQHIQNGENELAYTVYKEMVHQAQSIVQMQGE